MKTILLLLTLSFAAPAAAQPADPGEQAYQEGRKAYDLREWDKAIERFKEAYRIRSDAASLFNIAQSYRLKGDCVEALGFYKTYKRNFATAPNIDKVDKFITDLEPCAKERGAKQPEPATGPTTTTTTTQGSQPSTEIKLPPPTDRDPGKGKRTTGVIVGGIGVVLVGTGLGFAFVANKKANEVTNNGDPSMPPEFDKSVEDSGKRFELLSRISLGVGGAAAIAGTVMYMLGRKATAEARVGVAPASGGAIVTWGGAL